MAQVKTFYFSVVKIFILFCGIYKTTRFNIFQIWLLSFYFLKEQ